MVLRVPSKSYKEMLGDIWEVGITEEEYALVNLPDMAPVPVYSQTVTVQQIPFFNNRVGFVSQFYGDLYWGEDQIGELVSGNLIIHQIVSHQPIANRFTVSTTIPIKQFTINGIEVSQIYLNQVQGFFNFDVNNVAGFESLYAFDPGETLVITNIIPFGIGG